MSDGATYEREFPAMRRDAYRAAFAVLHDAALADDAASDALVQVWLHWPDLPLPPTAQRGSAVLP